MELIIDKENSWLNGIRMYSADGNVMFTTGGCIEDEDDRNNFGFYKLVSFELKRDERIIGIRSHDFG